MNEPQFSEKLTNPCEIQNKIGEVNQPRAEREQVQTPLSASNNSASLNDIFDDIRDKYEIHGQIGRGTQGSVFEATRRSDGLPVAIKLLNIESIENWKAYDLFWREVETLKSVSTSGVARFYEAIENLNAPKPHAYLVQQRIQGLSMSELIRSGRRFSLQDVFLLGIQLIDLLDRLHHHEPPIIHRDIKPSNLILEPAGNGYKLYLVDFGAVANPKLQKGGSTIAGTYGYMPPEQLMGHPTPASDIYAVGALLAGVLAGMEPSDMEIVDYKLVIEKPLEGLPHAVVTCLRQMTNPDQKQRLCDYDRIRTLFNQFAHNQFIETNLDTSTQGHGYNKALQNVHHFAQKGNIDLWMQLSEQTPRKIPSPYLYANNNAIRPFINLWANRFHPAFFLKKPHYTSLGILYIILGSIVALIVGILYSICKGVLIPVICIILFIFCFIISVLIYPIRSIISLCTVGQLIPLNKFMLYNYFNDDSAEQEAQDTMLELIKTGRKSLAQVINIQYEYADVNNVEFYSIQDKPTWDDSSWLGNFNPSPKKPTYCAGYCSRPAKFHLYYSFNPPDDSDPEALVHDVILPFDPRESLQIGDMIPILYLIKDDKGTDVRSMPFPLPISRIDQVKEIVYPHFVDKSEKEEKK